MKLFPPPIAIGDKEGFSAENDIFHRKADGDRLTNLVKQVSDPLVVAVDAQWGQGKTTFLKMWAGSLREAGFPVIFFDAFENDYAEDAFAALASQVIALAESKKKTASKNIKETAIKAGKVLIRSGLKIGIRAATWGLLNYAELADAAKEVLSDEVAALEDEYIGSLLTAQAEQRTAIDAFRQALSELPILLSAGKAKPLIFIIDELDRCRPDFALSLLERTKHFFSVQNVHFILGVNLQQLVDSIAVTYGPKIDGMAYLRKFINIVFPLVDTSRHEHEKVVSVFINHLTRAMDFPQRTLCTNTIEIIRYIAEVKNLNLRDIEQILSVLALAFASMPPKIYVSPEILAGLAALRVIDNNLFTKAKTGNLTFDEVSKALSLAMVNRKIGNQNLIVNIWNHAAGGGGSVQERAQIERDLRLSAANLKLETIIPYHANAVLDRMTFVDQESAARAPDNQRPSE